MNLNRRSRQRVVSKAILQTAPNAQCHFFSYDRMNRRRSGNIKPSNFIKLVFKLSYKSHVGIKPEWYRAIIAGAKHNKSECPSYPIPIPKPRRIYR
jgi:hypothetical protein